MANQYKASRWFARLSVGVFLSLLQCASAQAPKPDAALCQNRAGAVNLIASLRDGRMSPQQVMDIMEGKHNPATPHDWLKKMINAVYFVPSLRAATPDTLTEATWEDCVGLVKNFEPLK